MSQCCSQKVIYSFFGPPGSGKGTLAELCKRKLGYKVLSTGNLCRKHVSLGTDFGKMLDAFLTQGRLIPDDLVTDMVTDWIEDTVEEGKPIILDGFPRTRQQADLFLDFLEAKLPYYTLKVISFELSEDEIVSRLTGGKRRVCGNNDCQAVYSDVVAPKCAGLCDYCGSPLVQRSDDSESLVRERLKYYPDYKAGLFDYYESIRLPIERLYVEGILPQEVFDKFVKLRQNSPSPTKSC